MSDTIMSLAGSWCCGLFSFSTQLSGKFCSIIATEVLQVQLLSLDKTFTCSENALLKLRCAMLGHKLRAQ